MGHLTRWRLRRLHLFVGAVVVAAPITTALAARFASPPVTRHWPLLPLLAVLVVAGERFEVRYQFRGAVEAFTLVEAAIAPLVIGFPVLVAVLTVGAAELAVSVLGRNRPIKAVFNCAQWSLATAVAAIIVSAAAGTAPSPARLLAALLAGLATMSLVNQLAMATVISLAGTSGPGVLSPTMIVARAINAVAVLCFAVLSVAVYLWLPWGIAFFFAPLLILHAAGRGLAAVQVDRRRLDALQEVTHQLAATLDPQVAFPEALRAVRRSFEVAAVELLVLGEDESTVHRLLRSGYEQHVGVSSTDTDVAAIGLLERAGSQPGPLRLTAAQHPGLAAAGWQDCLAVPLRSGLRLQGLLCLYDRTGMVAFEDGELAVASAVAAEIVSFLARAALISSVRDERRMLADIVGSTSDGIFTLDETGRIDSWNAGLEAITGYRAADMVGTAHFGQLRPRDAAGTDLYLEHWAAEGHHLPSVVQVMTATGDVVWLSCSYTPVPAQPDRPARLVVVARNTTAERELERLKDDFVAVVSHELRTPLSSIKGWTTTLLSRRDRMTPDQQRHGLEAINRQAHRLEQLVLNILEASRIEAGATVTDAPVDVAHVVVKVVEDVVALYPSRTVRVSGTQGPALALGQHVWVERAVANLVYNAVKYSADAEPVDVAVHWAGTEVTVTVTDRGPGIPPEATERIFDRFERLPGAQTQTGTGLGLYITRQLVTAMGGAVTVSSVVGSGSTFTLRLRAAALRVPEQPRGPLAWRDASRSRA